MFQIGRMKEEYGIVESESFQSLTIQATGGTRKTIEAGLERIRAMLPSVSALAGAGSRRARSRTCSEMYAMADGPTVNGQLSTLD